jgi:hypothetical protein
LSRGGIKPWPVTTPARGQACLFMVFEDDHIVITGGLFQGMSLGNEGPCIKLIEQHVAGREATPAALQAVLDDLLTIDSARRLGGGKERK